MTKNKYNRLFNMTKNKYKHDLLLLAYSTPQGNTKEILAY